MSRITRAVLSIAMPLVRSRVSSTHPIQSLRPSATTSTPVVAERFEQPPRFWRRIAYSAVSGLQQPELAQLVEDALLARWACRSLLQQRVERRVGVEQLVRLGEGRLVHHLRAIEQVLDIERCDADGHAGLPR